MPVMPATGGSVMPPDGINRPFTKAGDLVANDFAGQCVVGSIAINTTGGRVFACTATNGTSTATWQLVGAQT